MDMKGVSYDGSCLYWINPFIPGGELGIYRFLRTPDGRKEMNILYLLAGLITLALFIYLIVALLKPERFE